jgi:outer membrane protein insertion porin family
MQQLCKFLVSAFIVNFIFCQTGFAQVPVNTDTTGQSVTSINSDLLNVFNDKNPKKYKIANIKVSGNKSFDQTLLLSIAELNAGDEVQIPGGDNFAKAITKLWSQNYFSNIEIYLTALDGNNIDVEIAVTERPRLANFIFKGIKKGETDDLTTKSGLIKGRVITENMKHTATDAIKKFYADKGFRGASVQIEQRPDSLLRNSLDLIFDIDKGAKVRINNIDFAGNTVSSQSLLSQMKETHQMSHLTLYPEKDTVGFASPKVYTFKDYLHDVGYLSPGKTKKVVAPYFRLNFLQSAKFDQTKFEDDKNKIVDYYNTLGFRDAAVVKDTSIIDSKGNINIDIKVDEGHKYYFGNIVWRGNTLYSDSLLTTILGIKKGDTYNADILNTKLGKSISPEGGDISGLYMDNGYLFFEADPIETAVYKDTIDFEIHLREGPQATIKNVRISGNEKTKEYVVRRELRTVPGEKFSRTDLVRSQREISNLGFFDPEKTTPNVIPNTDDGTVDINWSLQEKSSDQLELSAGFGGAIGLTGTLGVTFNNFSIHNIFKKSAWDPLPTGDGQKLSIRFQSNGGAYRSYNISFTEPWFGGKKRNSLTVSLFDTRFANAYNPLTGTYTSSSADTSYFRTTGVSVGLAKQLKWPDDYFQLGFTLAYARYKLHNYYIDQVNLPNFNNGFSNNLSLKIALERSSIDQPTFPRNGSDFVASVQATPPFSLLDPSLVTSSNPYEWIEYHKWRFDGTWYVPLGQPTGENHDKQFVLKLSAKYGFIGRYDSKLDISPFERFQVGDAGLSNSYALLGYEIISQRGYPVYQTSDTKINPDQTGASEYFTIFNKYTTELRYPLSLAQSSTIYGLAFFEAANGWYTFQDYNPFQLRRSVGIGMRFFLPMFGLLGFDYGIGLDRYGPGSTSLKDISRFTFMLGYEPE